MTLPHTTKLPQAGQCIPLYMNQSRRHKTGFVAALPALLVLLLNLCCATLMASETEQQVVITDIIVNRSNIFALPADTTGPPVQGQRLAQTVNRFHKVTLESVILRAAGIDVGDTIPLVEVDEIERRLRNLGIFASVDATLVTTDEGVELHITTRDTFSIVAGFTGSFLGGVGNLGFTAGERNLFGTGNRLQFGFARSTRDGFRGSVSFRDLHFFNKPWQADYSIGRTSDGDFFSAVLSDRFRTLSDRYEWSVALDYVEFFNEFYLDGRTVLQIPEDRSRLVTRQTWRWGEADRFLLTGLEVSFQQSEFSQPAGSFQGITQPVDTRTLFIGGSFTSDRVSGRKELLGLDTLNFVQDIRLGTAARVELGVNVEDDFNTDEDVQLDPSVSVLLNRASTLGKNTLLRTTLSADALFEEAGERAWNATARVGVYNTAIDKLTLAFNADYTTGEDGSDLPIQLTLGESNGLRGYETRQFQGRQRLRTNLEARYNAGWKLGFLDVGIIGFADAGWAAARDDTSPSLNRSIGAGLRLGSNALFGSRVFRIDVAFPLDPPPGDDSNPSLSAALGQVFRF